jgi:hypothetical protein
MSELTFTFHAPRQSLSIGKEAHNALLVDGESRILVFGNELSTEDRATLTEAFATQGGTVVLDADAPVSLVRSNVSYVLGKSKRKGVFGRITANTPDAPTVGYTVSIKS